jgi:hypothetical protein
MAAAFDLTQVLLHPSPASALARISDSHRHALHELATIFGNAVAPPTEPRVDQAGAPRVDQGGVPRVDQAIFPRVAQVDDTMGYPILDPSGEDGDGYPTEAPRSPPTAPSVLPVGVPTVDMVDLMTAHDDPTVVTSKLGHASPVGLSELPYLSGTSTTNDNSDVTITNLS